VGGWGRRWVSVSKRAVSDCSPERKAQANLLLPTRYPPSEEEENLPESLKRLSKIAPECNKRKKKLWQS
jgi:hypothetical protein